MLKSAIKNIPRGFRKKHIPGWTSENETLLKQYELFLILKPQIRFSTSKFEKITSGRNRRKSRFQTLQQKSLAIAKKVRSSRLLQGRCGEFNKVYI